MTITVEQLPDLIAAPVGGSPFEQVPSGEPAAIAAITEVIEQRVRATAAADPPARRDAHPKMHGCVEAELRVLDGLPPALAKGLFAVPATYQAWVRFSNGSGAPAPDSHGDGRGMAVKVLGVGGSRSGTQDFIMINNPTFFVPDAAEYVDFNKAANPFTFFLPDLNPLHVRLHDALTALAIAGRKVSNPLNSQYWSMTPYLYEDVPCKYSARPAGPPSVFEDRTDPDFLRDNLVKALSAGDAVFDFCIQLQSDPEAMPVEDPTIEWRDEVSPFVPVARLTIPRQGFDTPERRALGENLSFTPWHGLDAHRPLGGINRVRRTVYETISRVRHEINGTLSVEPASLTPQIEAAIPDAAPAEAAAADTFFDRFLSLAGDVVDIIPWADAAASKTVIDALVRSTINRPHPWSTASDYTSWKALTDRTYQGRQLPVGTRDVADLPPARDGGRGVRAAGRRTAAVGEIDLPVSGLRAVPDRRLHPHRGSRPTRAGADGERRQPRAHLVEPRDRPLSALRPHRGADGRAKAEARSGGRTRQAQEPDDRRRGISRPSFMSMRASASIGSSTERSTRRCSGRPRPPPSASPRCSRSEAIAPIPRHSRR